MYILVDIALSNQDHHNFSIICGRLPKKFSCQGQVHISYNPLLRDQKWKQIIAFKNNQGTIPP